MIVATKIGPATLHLATSGSYVDPVPTNDAAVASIEIEQATAALEGHAPGGRSGGGGSVGLLFLGVLGLLGLWRTQAHPA